MNISNVVERTRPSLLRERYRRNVAAVVELYARLRDIVIYSYGPTLLSEAACRGAEPDECYALGAPIVDVPDLALEVIVSETSADKLSVYASLGVPEVWLFEDEELSVHFLDVPTGTYWRRERSWFLPDLDIELAARLAIRADTAIALRELANVVATS